MKEFETIIKDVKEALATKQKEIAITGSSVIAYTVEDFKNREMEVFAFEANILKVLKEPCVHSELVVKFKNDAQELIIEINKIKVT